MIGTFFFFFLSPSKETRGEKWNKLLLSANWRLLIISLLTGALGQWQIAYPAKRSCRAGGIFFPAS